MLRGRLCTVEDLERLVPRLAGVNHQGQLSCRGPCSICSPEDVAAWIVAEANAIVVVVEAALTDRHDLRCARRAVHRKPSMPLLASCGCTPGGGPHVVVRRGARDATATSAATSTVHPTVDQMGHTRRSAASSRSARAAPTFDFGQMAVIVDPGDSDCRTTWAVSWRRAGGTAALLVRARHRPDSHPRRRRRGPADRRGRRRDRWRATAHRLLGSGPGWPGPP